MTDDADSNADPQDDDNDEAGDGQMNMSFQFLGMPDPAELKAQADRRAMIAEDSRRALYRLIQEVSNEHLVTLRWVFEGGVPEAMAEHLAGLIMAQCLWVRHICPICGDPEHDMTPEACARRGL